jgi:hypothetical protein
MQSNVLRQTIKLTLVPAIFVVTALTMQNAAADVIQLSYSAISSGTTGSGSNIVLPVPGSHTFGNSFGGLTTPVYTSSSGQGYEFYDDYVFSITGASANVLTSSINLGEFLGLDNFQVRLYELAGNEPLPHFGTPVGTTLLEAWSTQLNYSPGMSGLLAVIPEHQLNPGSYVLEIRGNVSGQFGGSYTGVMNLAPVAPVPLPAAVWLLFSGLSMIGSVNRFRR